MNICFRTDFTNVNIPKNNNKKAAQMEDFQINLRNTANIPGQNLVCCGFMNSFETSFNLEIRLGCLPNVFSLSLTLKFNR